MCKNVCKTASRVTFESGYEPVPSPGGTGTSNNLFGLSDIDQEKITMKGCLTPLRHSFVKNTLGAVFSPTGAPTMVSPVTFVLSSASLKARYTEVSYLSEEPADSRSLFIVESIVDAAEDVVELSPADSTCD